MKNTCDAARLSSAQRAWDFAGLSFCDVGTVMVTEQPDVLRYAAGIDGWDDDDERAAELPANRFCPPDVLADVAAGSLGQEPAAVAVSHRDCPPDVAARTIAAWVGAGSEFALDTLMFLPADTLRLIAERVPASDWCLGAQRLLLGDMVAVSNNGFLTSDVSDDVARWLAGREIADLCRLDTPLLGRLGGRADLTGAEVIACVDTLASRGAVEWIEPFLEMQQVTCGQAAAVIALPSVRKLEAWGRAKTLVPLLAGRTPRQLRTLGERARDAGLLNRQVTRTLWYESSGAVVSEDLFADFAPEWQRDSQRDMPVRELLNRAAPPADLVELTERQLLVACSLAPAWQGTFGSLLAVAQRA